MPINSGMFQIDCFEKLTLLYMPSFSASIMLK